MRPSGAWLLAFVAVAAGSLSGCVREAENAQVELYVLRPAGTFEYGFVKLNVTGSLILFKNATGLGQIVLARAGPHDLTDPRLKIYEGPIRPDAYVAVRISFENGTGTLQDGSEVPVRFSANRLSNNLNLELSPGEEVQVQITSQINRLAAGDYVIV